MRRDDGRVASRGVVLNGMARGLCLWAIILVVLRELVLWVR